MTVISTETTATGRTATVSIPGAFATWLTASGQRRDRSTEQRRSFADALTTATAQNRGAAYSLILTGDLVVIERLAELAGELTAPGAPATKAEQSTARTVAARCAVVLAELQQQ